MSLVNMKKLLDEAKKSGIACGAFNVGNMEMVRGVVKAAEEMKTPVILQIAEGRLKHSPLELMGPMMVEAAKTSVVDIAVHFDHGKSIDKIQQALEMGFTSVMLDGSELPFKENVEKTNKVRKMALDYGADVEAELGVVGGSEDESDACEIKYTDPVMAKLFCERTEIAALAVAIGNAHGNYSAEPKLAFDVLKQIEQLTDTHLVLHGGSGISEQDFRTAIRAGISKVNIATSNFNAYMGGLKNYREANEPLDFFRQSESVVESICENVKNHIKIFNDVK